MGNKPTCGFTIAEQIAAEFYDELKKQLDADITKQIAGNGGPEPVGLIRSTTNEVKHG